MAIIFLGIAAELIAIALTYGVYAFTERISLYAIFYVPVFDRLILPALPDVAAATKPLIFTVYIILVLINSLKWAGCIVLFQRGWRILGAAFAALLVATIVISVSLKGLGI